MFASHVTSHRSWALGMTEEPGKKISTLPFPSSPNPETPHQHRQTLNSRGGGRCTQCSFSALNHRKIHIQPSSPAGLGPVCSDGCSSGCTQTGLYSVLPIPCWKIQHSKVGLEHYSFNFSQSILLVWYLSALKEENLFKPITYC